MTIQDSVLGRWARRAISFAVTFGVLFSTSVVLAQRPGGSNDPNAAEIQSLKDRLSKLEAQSSLPSPLADQMTQMQLQQSLPDALGSGFTGLGPAASKIYSSRLPVAIGAVGELSYASLSSAANSTSIANADLLLGARLSQRLIFNSAFSLEAKSQNQVAGTNVHYAYVDFLVGPEAGVRVGNLLIPVGVTNLRFEPTMYPMVNRPIAEELVIPTDWNENGVLGFWRTPNVTWQAGVVTAGDISLVSGPSWLRDGRQAGQSARADSVAYVARVETNSAALPSGRPRPSVGASVYSGSWSQGDHTRFGDATVTIGELHGGLSFWRMKAEALYVEGRLANADQISTSLSRGVASRTRGATAVVSFDLLPPAAQRAASLLGVDSSPFYHELPIFLSYEMADAQADLPTGFTADRNSYASIWTAGINYLPHEQFVLKGDYAIRHDRTGFETRAIEAALGVTF